jgi:hypothetical protein
MNKSQNCITTPEKQETKWGTYMAHICLMPGARHTNPDQHLVAEKAHLFVLNVFIVQLLLRHKNETAMFPQKKSKKP